MVVFSRGAAIAPGKTATAIAFTPEISANLKTTCGIELEVLMPGSIRDALWRTVCVGSRQ